MKWRAIGQPTLLWAGRGAAVRAAGHAWISMGASFLPPGARGNAPHAALKALTSCRRGECTACTACADWAACHNSGQQAHVVQVHVRQA
jgi:hypothetical protein